jgi:hypothetical protein
LKSRGFQQSTTDPRVFINDRGIIITAYIDGILVFGKSSKDIKNIKNHLCSFHEMKDGGRVNKILGIRITWKPDGSIRLDQEAYTQVIIKESKMEDCKLQQLPMSLSLKLDDNISPQLRHKGMQGIEN